MGAEKAALLARTAVKEDVEHVEVAIWMAGLSKTVPSLSCRNNCGRGRVGVSLGSG